MGLFRKKLPSFLEDPILVDLYALLQDIQKKSSEVNDDSTKEQILELILECDKFDSIFQTQLPNHFMLRVNQTDLPTYKYIQSWIMDINGIKTHNLGSYIILWAHEQKGAKKVELEKEFKRISAGLRKSSYGGHEPSLKNSLSYHNIELDKLA